MTLDKKAIIEALKLTVQDIDYDMYKMVEFPEDDTCPTWVDYADTFEIEYKKALGTLHDSVTA
jgi:hypothetical protein